MNFDSLTERKVLGIPLLYVVGAGVGGLAFYAWRTQRTEAPVEEEEVPGSPTAAVGELYPEMETGTVIVQQMPVETTPNTAISSNSDWLRKGIAFLTGENENALASQAALQTYLEGASLSTEEGQLVNRVMTEYGAPPDGAESATIAPVATGEVLYYIRRRAGAAVYAVHANHTRRWTEGRMPPLSRLITSTSDDAWNYPVAGADAPIQNRG